MGAYIEPIKMAVIVFPFIALLVSLPIFIYYYHKYGVFVKWFGVIVYSFILYMLVAYFLVILPLPNVEEVAKLTTPKYNLEPFTFIKEFLRYTVWQPTKLETYLPALKQPVVIQPLFNIFLTVPFGVYLRYGFKRSLKQTLVLSFALSLFFELTQLSGLYGLYPRPYRLFDVDDLMLNTFGGVLGYWLTPVFKMFFPKDEKLAEIIRDKAKHPVTYLRRFVAFIVDWLLVNALLSVLEPMLAKVFPSMIYTSFIFLFYYIVVPAFIFKGQTLGKKIVNIRIVDANIEGESLHLKSLIIRQSLFLLNIFIVFYLFANVLQATGYVPEEQLDTYYYLSLILGGYTLLMMAHVGINMLFRKKQLVYEKLSHTIQVSTK